MKNGRDYSKKSNRFSDITARLVILRKFWVGFIDILFIDGIGFSIALQVKLKLDIQLPEKSPISYWNFRNTGTEDPFFCGKYKPCIYEFLDIKRFKVMINHFFWYLLNPWCESCKILCGLWCNQWQVYDKWKSLVRWCPLNDARLR